MEFNIMVLPGDGIGPEVVAEGVRVLQAIGARSGHKFNLSYDDVGGVAIDRYGVPVRPQTLEACRKADAILFGAVGGPKWDDPRAKVRPEQGILALRKGLGLFANLRPVRVFPQLVESSVLKPQVVKGVDILVIRELTGGLYFAQPKKRWETKLGWRAVDTCKYTQQEIERVVRVGFELARTRRKKLTSVDKANVLETSRLWREVTTRIGQEYPDVALEHVLVDSFAMQLIQRPTRFDVVVTDNMFGDILTDEASVLTASMGMLPSASLAGLPRPGHRALGLYEPIHGTAPDIAGKGIANPLATILSVALLLRYSLGLYQEAASIEQAVDRVLAQGVRTADIAGEQGESVSTREMGDRVIQALE